MNVNELEKLGINCPKNGLLIVQISSKWCKSCIKLKSILKNFEEQGLINLIIIDIDFNPQLSRLLEIRSIPSLIFFKNGELIEKNIEINNFLFLKNGIMDGIASESIIREILIHI